MTITVESDQFVAWCDESRGCAYNTLFTKSHPAQLQQTIVEVMLSSSIIAGESLHSRDGAAKRKRRDPLADLSTIERKQLDAFIAKLLADGWIAKRDRSRPLGFYTVCHRHK